MTTKTLINGHFSQSIDADDRGLAYGDGLFETIKVSAGLPQFINEHLQRLASGCDRLRIACDEQLLRKEINRLLSVVELDQGILKIIISRGQRGRGYRPELGLQANRIISLSPSSLDYSHQQSAGVAVRLCDTRLSINPLLAGMKHLCRLENVLARAEWHDDTVAEGLMLDMEGRLVEGTMSNIFLVKDGRLCTPALHRCGVEGVVREVILGKLSSQLSLPCQTSELAIQDIYSAEELFLCNSLIGIWPIIAVGCHQKKLGSVTLKIQAALANIQSAINDNGPKDYG